jgi:hypothetical protein
MRYLSWVILLLAASGQAHGLVTLVLTDGQVIVGDEVVRKGNDVIVTMFDDSVLVLPAAAILETQLSEVGEPLAEEPIVPEPEEEAEEPRVLAGRRLEFPKSAEQLAVFGDPPALQRDVVNTRWRPSSDWRMDPENNQFAPSTWRPSPVDSSWTPVSAFDSGRDVLASGRSTWRKNVIDNSWTPHDGFGW